MRIVVVNATYSDSVQAFHRTILKQRSFAVFRNLADANAAANADAKYG